MAACQLLLGWRDGRAAFRGSPNRPPRWQRLDHDERRRQILECARRLFSERPYASVSTTELAREAGVARGLLHHYFGSKRDLYLEVVRTLVRVPTNPVPLEAPGRGIEVVIDESVERWLTMLERNSGTWLAAIGGRGVGRDPELEEILEDAREQAADRLIEALQTLRGRAARRRSCAPRSAPTRDSPRPRASSGSSATASRESSSTRCSSKTFLTLVRDVVPAVQRRHAA